MHECADECKETLPSTAVTANRVHPQVPAVLTVYKKKLGTRTHSTNTTGKAHEHQTLNSSRNSLPFYGM
jgi:hypothetical protein